MRSSGSAMGRLLGFFGRYLLWLALTVGFSFAGMLLVIWFADWTLGRWLASALVWPLFGLATVAGLPMALLGWGRLYFVSAIGGGVLLGLLPVLL